MKKLLEDDFDIDEYKTEYLRNLKVQKTNKNKVKYITAINILIAVVAFVMAIFIFTNLQNFI